MKDNKDYNRPGNFFEEIFKEIEELKKRVKKLEKKGVLDMNKIKLIKWKGDKEVEEMHRHDYRWIENKEEREKWIRENWEVKEQSK